MLNEASRELPFTTATQNIKNEELRLRYRYLDLRRAEMQQNLVARSSIVSGLREVSKPVRAASGLPAADRENTAHAY